MERLEQTEKKKRKKKKVVYATVDQKFLYSPCGSIYIAYTQQYKLAPKGFVRYASPTCQ